MISLWDGGMEIARRRLLCIGEGTDGATEHPHEDDGHRNQENGQQEPQSVGTTCQEFTEIVPDHEGHRGPQEEDQAQAEDNGCGWRMRAAH